jgi:hypothetical protein
MEPPGAWDESPFKIAGNIYYVGSKGLANYLITTALAGFPEAAYQQRSLSKTS